MTKIAINGLGRIGRATFKVVLDHPELALTWRERPRQSSMEGYRNKYSFRMYRILLNNRDAAINPKRH